MKDRKHTNLIWITVLFDEAFKYGDGAKFWGNAGTNAETLYTVLKFCATAYHYKLFNMFK